MHTLVFNFNRTRKVYICFVSLLFLDDLMVNIDRENECINYLSVQFRNIYLVEASWWHTEERFSLYIFTCICIHNIYILWFLWLSCRILRSGQFILFCCTIFMYIHTVQQLKAAFLLNVVEQTLMYVCSRYFSRVLNEHGLADAGDAYIIVYIFCMHRENCGRIYFLGNFCAAVLHNKCARVRFTFAIQEWGRTFWYGFCFI